MALNKKNNASEYGTYMNMSDGMESDSISSLELKFIARASRSAPATKNRTFKPLMPYTFADVYLQM